jgi:hypothetical protein
VWAGEIPIAAVDGQVSNSGASNPGNTSSIGFDGTTPSETSNGTTSVAVNANMAVSLSVPKVGLAEGFHYATALGVVTSGTGTWSGGAQPGARLSVKVYIAPRK